MTSGKRATNGLGMMVPVKPKGKNGGARPGAGRPKNSHRHLQQTLTIKQKYPIMPLEHMLKILNDEKAPPERKDDMAKSAAPYIHPRLAAVHISQGNNVRHSIDVTKLTDDELDFFERIIAKAQVMVPDDGQDEQDPIEAMQLGEKSMIIDHDEGEG